MRISWLIAVSSLAFAFTSPAVATEPREFILSNGMKVLLVEVPKAPVATVQVWYKVGSRNEVMGRAGLSHMLEHMMFKGTAKYPKGRSRGSSARTAASTTPSPARTSPPISKILQPIASNWPWRWRPTGCRDLSSR